MVGELSVEGGGGSENIYHSHCSPKECVQDYIHTRGPNWPYTKRAKQYI